MKRNQKIKIIGIAGKTGCGKSTVADYLADKLKPAIKIDVDMIAKEIYEEKKDVADKLAACFGQEIINPEGSIDFSYLGTKVFSDYGEMKKLNNLMFPLIYDKVERLIRQNSDKKFIIIDAAVLFDAGLDNLCDKIIWVKADSGKQESILKCKNINLAAADIRQRIKNQKIKIIRNKVDFIIVNNSTLKDLYKSINNIIIKLQTA
ncbi:MAG: dephospho-CoA kinase [Actinobacteria bacterium]|nr:dephospho-CoA kinase [Actinomycetota bacterium]